MQVVCDQQKKEKENVCCVCCSVLAISPPKEGKKIYVAFICTFICSEHNPNRPEKWERRVSLLSFRRVYLENTPTPALLFFLHPHVRSFWDKIHNPRKKGISNFKQCWMSIWRDVTSERTSKSQKVIIRRELKKSDCISKSFSCGEKRHHYQNINNRTQLAHMLHILLS